MKPITNSKKGKANFIWNSTAGLINAAEAVILLMVVTRTNGLVDAGIITIAFTIGNLMMTIGKFGIRNYQVTDVKEVYSFRNYYSHRMVTVAAMLLASSFYLAGCLLWKDYSIYKAAIILLICGIYMVESLEDVFWGLYQKNGRLDLGGKIFSYRWLIQLMVISIFLIATKRMVLSLGVGLISGTIYTFYTNRRNVSQFVTIRPRFSSYELWPLTKQCLPLFLAAFMTSYVTNAPKYAIDTYMSEEIQACYGFISMPVFVISLLNSFIYQPIIVKIALDWQEKRMHLFKKHISRQIFLIALLTIVCILGGYILGIPVLSAIYSTDLSPYKPELIVLLAGGGLLALVGFLCVLMTIMRIQKKMVFGYGIAAGLACFFSGHFVKAGGIMGAAVLYVILMVFLASIFTLMVASECKKRGNNNAEIAL